MQHQKVTRPFLKELYDRSGTDKSLKHLKSCVINLSIVERMSVDDIAKHLDVTRELVQRIIITTKYKYYGIKIVGERNMYKYLTEIESERLNDWKKPEPFNKNEMEYGGILNAAISKMPNFQIL